MSEFYKMDPAAWDFGTANLSLEEEAAYLRIINAIHKHDRPVPDNDRVLAGLFRCSTRKARSLVKALERAGKIRIEDGAITNDRAVSEMVHRQFVSISRAESGAKGGRTRADNARRSLKSNEPPQAVACPRIEENRIEVREEDKSSSLSSNRASPPDEIAPAVAAYNAAADAVGWPRVQKLTAARRAALRARLADSGGLPGWEDALARARASPHLTGQNDRGWTASFDFLTNAASFAKLMEGNYDPRPQHAGGGRAPGGANPGRGGQPLGVVGAAMRSRSARGG